MNVKQWMIECGEMAWRSRFFIIFLLLCGGACTPLNKACVRKSAHPEMFVYDGEIRSVVSTSFWGFSLPPAVTLEDIGTLNDELIFKEYTTNSVSLIRCYLVPVTGCFMLVVVDDGKMPSYNTQMNSRISEYIQKRIWEMARERSQAPTTNKLTDETKAQDTKE